ncbi:hypothetical protein CC1G_00013 [Coprinopsis cinerea okayama7|uniref:Protein BIG1 n=1 Tax=Coprinopsis cinerea (strain Okayama-7 / 130 / ATCC MYA-4618 / FGSC 9003) TaxID=240176 RepID=A8NWF0_COPC7|nr:hypothetical protein CC1G_00013 [Coprinopsis cinerea okayama7\|eukprot:XP_001836877.1 hypothetical protein CC1G_00013 [Coprinopsis cinerea okayama7\
MARHFVLLAAFAPLVLAYSNTAPLLAWSSSQSNAIDNLPTSGRQASAILDSILTDDSICDFDAVVLVQHPGVHASDLRTLSSDSEITRALKDAPSSRSYPYVLNEEAGWALRQVAPGVAKMCGSRMVKYAPGEDTSDVQLDSGEKYAVVLDAPTLVGEGEERGDIMDEQSTAIASELQLLSAAFPNHLVIYAGLPVSSHFARAPAVFAPSNTTLPDGGILKKYQLLTPGLIVSLLVVLFVFLPVLYIGITSLAGIQNPVKMDLPKGFNAQEKKNQ